LPQLPLHNRHGLSFALLLVGIIGLNLAAPRFWCRYLCPLGGLLGLFGKVSLFKRRVDDSCTSCDRCARACPTGAISSDKAYASDPAECTLCMDCFDLCPEKSIALKPDLGLDNWREHNPGRRETLLTLGAAVFATALLKNDRRKIQPHDFLIQPPGGEGNDLVGKCIRCGLCVQVCPTGGLQPAVDEAGVEGFWTPVLVPRLGMCDYSCNACGQVCPVEAIPPLDLETKREQVIGWAYIDQNRCIAWADHTDCIVCEEMCPLPEKAITLEETEVTGGPEGAATVLLPYVDRETCIGCGICEYKCPIIGESAIRVYTSAAFGMR
jgi:ferredoxin